jgi:hypothetical protein
MIRGILSAMVMFAGLVMAVLDVAVADTTGQIVLGILAVATLAGGIGLQGGAVFHPGGTRAIAGMLLGGFTTAMLYRGLADGGNFSILAIVMLALGFGLGALRGLAAGAVLYAVQYALFRTTSGLPASDTLGTIANAVVALAVIPSLMVLLGLSFKGAWGAVIAALAAAPAFLTVLIFFPQPRAAGPNNGATLIFGGLGMAFGALWGIGAFSPGASAHEGPRYYAAQHVQPNPLIVLAKQAFKAAPGIMANVRPLLRPLMVAIGIALAITAVIMAASTLLPITRVQTNNVAASASAVTGDKFIMFVIVSVVILGAVGTLAVLLALGVNALTRQVGEAKKAAAEPVKVEQNKLFRFIGFIVSWVQDILQGTRKSMSR